jgi:predicted lipase
VYRDFPFEVSCYTFGSPRVGNAAFVEAFRALVKTSWRVHTYYDLIPMLPPAWAIFGYTHVNSPVCPHLDSDSVECSGILSLLCSRAFQNAIVASLKMF